MLTAYLDTSVINFLFAEDAPEKQEITIDFFDNFVKTGIYKTFVSEFVIAEIDQTRDLLKGNQLKQVIKDYHIEILEITQYDEIETLAELYLENKVIPEKYRVDALHVACTVIFNINYLVSWNYKHLANVNRERKVVSVNLANNYLNPIRILSPQELIYYGS